MHTRRTLVRLASAGLAVLTCGVLLAAGTPQANPSATGPASGSWHLPEGPSLTGSVHGVLQTVAGVTLFQLDGVLTEVSSPCLACREGDLNGTLDDGSGGAPEFVVIGHWSVTQFAWQGSFHAQIYRPIGPFVLPVGRIGGLVSDPAIPPGVPGTFSGRWGLRR